MRNQKHELEVAEIPSTYIPSTYITNMLFRPSTFIFAFAATLRLNGDILPVLIPDNRLNTVRVELIVLTAARRRRDVELEAVANSGPVSVYVCCEYSSTAWVRQRDRSQSADQVCNRDLTEA